MLQAVRGTKDILPDVIGKWQFIEEVFLKVTKKFADSEKEKLEESFVNYIYEYKLNDAIKTQTHKAKLLDEYIQKNEPFKLVKSTDTLEVGKQIIKNLN